VQVHFSILQYLLTAVGFLFVFVFVFVFVFFVFVFVFFVFENAMILPKSRLKPIWMI
jgi:hypothetical protein